MPILCSNRAWVHDREKGLGGLRLGLRPANMSGQFGRVDEVTMPLANMDMDMTTT